MIPINCIEKDIIAAYKERGPFEYRRSNENWREWQYDKPYEIRHPLSEYYRSWEFRLPLKPMELPDKWGKRAIDDCKDEEKQLLMETQNEIIDCIAKLGEGQNHDRERKDNDECRKGDRP